MPKFLPTKEQCSDLLLEFWKAILTTLLGLVGAGILLIFPTVRAWTWNQLKALYAWCVMDHSISGFWIFVGAVALLICVCWLAKLLLDRLGPTYVRKFTEAGYDGLKWRWQWKRGQVESSSMKAYCLTCGTELKLQADAQQNSTVISCTYCNVAAGVGGTSDLPDLVRRKIEGDAREDRWRSTRQSLKTMKPLWSPKSAGGQSPS